MVRLWVCAALLLAAGFAGCIGDAETKDTGDGLPTTAATPQIPDHLEWGLSGCQAAILFIDLPGAAVQPHLPEGFQPLPSAVAMAGGSANPTNGGSFGVEMFTCESGVGLNETVQDIAYGSYFAFVEPPTALKDPEADLHFVKWDVLVPDAPRRALLQAAGVPAHDGTAAFSSFSFTGALNWVEGSMDMLGDHRLTGSTHAPGPDVVTFVEFTAVPDGLVAWKTRATTTVSGLGPGTVHVPAESLAAEILGTGPQDGTLMAFVGDFTAGTITFPKEA